MEALSLHEGNPGHHFQVSIQREQKSLPKFRRFGRGYTAYTEGWALYAESLGPELGMYVDPYQYFGRLEGELFRAIRLVVDTGLHSKGWTRERVLEYIDANSATSDARRVAETERYIAIPGQALAYKIGQLKISELRQRAERELGSQFDVRKFHTAILVDGALPLDVLEARVDRWIATQRGGSTGHSTPATLPGADQIVSRKLANGLEVVVWPDHDIPSIAMHTWYRVGSRNERPGITGISHFFEHMMFNGTKTRPPGEFDRVMEANGGSNNAYTSSDVTVYMNWFPRTTTELIFELESDRMRNLDFDPQAVESERGVVSSERRSRVDDDNFGTLYEQMQANAFVAHPYQIPVIGWPSDIAGWKVKDLQAYYEKYYAPNNAVMFVVGDVKPDEVFRLADQYLAGLAAQPAPEPVTTKEPPQLGERRIKVERAAQTPLLMMAWHATAAPDRQTRVMEMLLSILGSGDSSRLHQRLVEREQAAVEIGAFLDQGFDPGLAWAYAVVPPGGDVAKPSGRSTRDR
jgi:zinc protease